MNPRREKFRSPNKYFSNKTECRERKSDLETRRRTCANKKRKNELDPISIGEAEYLKSWFSAHMWKSTNECVFVVEWSRAERDYRALQLSIESDKRNGSRMHGNNANNSEANFNLN